MLLAVPLIILEAADKSFVFKSGNLIFAISSTWLIVMLPTFSLFGSPEPFFNPQASSIREVFEIVLKLI